MKSDIYRDRFDWKVCLYYICYHNYYINPINFNTMLTINLKSKLFLLVAFTLLSYPGCKAVESKQLTVKKISCNIVPSAESVPSVLDKNHIGFHKIENANWAEFPYKPEVSFRIAHTGKEILLHFKVKEASVRAVATQDNGRVWEDSCVEFFISPEGNDFYYNFECNCITKLLIQQGKPSKRTLADQTILSQVKRWSTMGTESFEAKKGTFDWELTLVIPATALYQHAINTFDGKRMKANFYKCGDELPTPHYISWSPIKTDKPKFHCPEFFGTIVFE